MPELTHEQSLFCLHPRGKVKKDPFTSHKLRGSCPSDCEVALRFIHNLERDSGKETAGHWTPLQGIYLNADKQKPFQHITSKFGECWEYNLAKG